MPTGQLERLGFRPPVPGLGHVMVGLGLTPRPTQALLSAHRVSQTWAEGSECDQCPVVSEDSLRRKLFVRATQEGGCPRCGGRGGHGMVFLVHKCLIWGSFLQ